MLGQNQIRARTLLFDEAAFVAGNKATLMAEG